MAILNLQNSNAEPCQLFLMRGRDILVTPDGQPVQILPDAVCIKDAIYDTITGTVGVELSQEFVPMDGSNFLSLRQFFAGSIMPNGCPAARPMDLGERPRLPDIRSGEDDAPPTPGYKCNQAALAARMKGYLNWRATVRYCPTCGAPLDEHPVENARVCPKCGKVHYPRISPCVIAVICKGDEMLLLKHVQRNQNIWCCLAGFVETGESLEQALVREVREEVGLEIENIRYAGSQSWPFPDQMMVGFYADYKSGEIRLQPEEIAAAEWFRKDNLPVHPNPGSISWNLIHYQPIIDK